VEDPSRLLPLWLPLWPLPRLPPRLPWVEAWSTCSTSHLHPHPHPPPPTEAGVLSVPLRPPRPLLTGDGTLSVPPPPLPHLKPLLGTGMRSAPPHLRPRLLRPRLPPLLAVGTHLEHPSLHLEHPSLHPPPPQHQPRPAGGTHLEHPSLHPPPPQHQPRPAGGTHSYPRHPQLHRLPRQPPLLPQLHRLPRQPPLLPQRLTTGARSRTPPQRQRRLPNPKSQRMTS
jgi:hypothetical protein